MKCKNKELNLGLQGCTRNKETAVIGGLESFASATSISKKYQAENSIRQKAIMDQIAGKSSSFCNHILNQEGRFIVVFRILGLKINDTH